MRKSYSVFSHLKEISWGFSGSPVAEPQRHRVSAWSGTRICTPCGRQAGRKERIRRQTGTSPDCFRPSRPRFWKEPTPCLPAPCRPFNRTLTPPTRLLSRPLFEQFLNSIRMLLQLNQFTEVMVNISQKSHTEVFTDHLKS